MRILPFLSLLADLPDPDSFPTRRSSDLVTVARVSAPRRGAFALLAPRLPPKKVSKMSLKSKPPKGLPPAYDRFGHAGDRKSTRLNSSHVEISYAVFCLKKKSSSLRAITG